MSCKEWQTTTIGDQILLQRGYDITKAEQKEGNVPVISSSGVKSFHETARVKGPGVVLGRKGVVGSVHFVKENYWPHDTTLFVKNFKGNNPHFVYYFFKWISERLSTMDVGSANPTLNRNHVHPIIVQWPPLPEQKAIVTILSCLDEKIELNNKINKTFEEMAQAIFKSWFVDFEPFQDGEFEDSELGKIPKGWQIFNIVDITLDSSTGGDAIKKTPMVDYNTGIKCVRVGDLSNKRGFDGWGYCKVDQENFKKLQLKKNDIIVTRTATLGLNQIIDEDLMAVFNNGLIRLKLNDKVIPLFFYYVINTDSYKEYIGRIESESSTRPNMKMHYLLKYRFICPPIKIQKEYINVVKGLREQWLNLNKQTKVLADIRDTLLPKLMSGEIRVPIEEVQ